MKNLKNSIAKSAHKRRNKTDCSDGPFFFLSFAFAFFSFSSCPRTVSHTLKRIERLFYYLQDFSRGRLSKRDSLADDCRGAFSSNPLNLVRDPNLEN